MLPLDVLSLSRTPPPLSVSNNNDHYIGRVLNLNSIQDKCYTAK